MSKQTFARRPTIPDVDTRLPHLIPCRGSVRFDHGCHLSMSLLTRHRQIAKRVPILEFVSQESSPNHVIHFGNRDLGRLYFLPRGPEWRFQTAFGRSPNDHVCLIIRHPVLRRRVTGGSSSSLEPVLRWRKKNLETIVFAIRRETDSCLTRTEKLVRQ